MQAAKSLTLLLFTVIFSNCNGNLGNKLENQRIRVDAVHVSWHWNPMNSILLEISLSSCRHWWSSSAIRMELRVTLAPSTNSCNGSRITCISSKVNTFQLWVTCHWWLRCRYDLYQEPNNRIGIQSANGSWNGLIGLLIRQVRNYSTIFIVNFNDQICSKTLIKKVG